MDSSLFPTKGNYILAKSRLALSRQGYELLDKKRNILVREVMSMLDQVEAIQKDMDDIFGEAYLALQEANIRLGINTVSQISQAIAPEENVQIESKSIMGVEIPILNQLDSDLIPQYGIGKTECSLDEAYLQFSKVKRLTLKLAEIENAIYRLAFSIKQTQKRANALKNIMIPKYEKLTKDIATALEEKEREEFSRLKMIKLTKQG
ncbi:V-type ATP synthase subunit D [Lachnospiraceae bacterium oral taxon 500]|nr:V-type ATP synthase subunit D [Lachnospiraceae bacterium oral taxon 500]